MTSPFRVSAMEGLEKEAKRTQWLHVSEVVLLTWMKKQVDEML